MPSKASAIWNGTLKEGDGRLRTGSGALDGPYTFKTRFEDGQGTNPEELIGAALAGCFSMALSADLERAGTPAESVETQATVRIRNLDGKPTIAQIDLSTTGRVPGIDESTFRKAADDAKENCIVSRALSVPEINLEVSFEA